MILQINTQPNLLLEAARLVCACVNGIEPQYLTAEEPSCIPVTEVAKMMETVCVDLDLNSSRVKFYFRGFAMPEGSEKEPACVACTLLGTYRNGDNSDIQQVRQGLHNSYLGSGKPYKMNTLGLYGFGYTPCDEYSPISEELDSLSVPDGLRLRMVEILTAYHFHVDQLCDLLEPLAERLRPLLEPWVRNAQPQIEGWHLALHDEDKRKQFLSRFCGKMDGLERIVLSPRMFYPAACNAAYSTVNGLFCMVGIGFQIGLPELDPVSPQVLTALRHLSSADRVKMLRIMAGRPVGPREIARKLDVNPGTVFRDLNGMHQAHLLTIVMEGSNRTYKTNLEFLRKVVQNLIEFIEGGQ